MSAPERPGDGVLASAGGRGDLPIASPARVRKELLAGLSGQRRLLALAVLLLSAGAAAGLVVPASLGAIVDVVEAGEGVRGVWCLVAVMVGGAVLAAVFDALGEVVAAYVVAGSLARLRERLVGRLLRLPIARVEAAGSGDAMSRAGDDVAEVTNAVDEVLPAVTGSLFAVAATVVGLGVLEWRLGLALLVVLPIYVLGVRRYLRDAPPIYAAERAAMGRRAEAVLSSLRGRPTVRAFGLEASRSALISRHSWEVVRWSVRARIVANAFWGYCNFAEFAGMASLLIVGFVLVDTGASTSGVTVAAVLFFLRLFGPIGQLLLVVDAWQSAAASLRRIVGVLDVPPARDAEVGPAHSDAALDLRDVRFTFDGHDVPTLHGIDLCLDAGSTVALVGASGAGKSTLAAVVAGLRGPYAGRVLLGATDLAHAGEEQRSRLVGLVTQETHVFAGTLRDNLTLATPDASDDEVWAALSTVGADGWVAALPERIGEVVGAEGTSLSTTQAQHLALARVALLDPPVVILDEATAEAGSAGAAALDAAAAAVTRGRTTLVIAHRLDQAVACDRIVVLDVGRVVEEGAPEALRAAGGPFATLWAAWSAGR